MGSYIIRRTLYAVPTLILISMIIFGILDMAPGDPTSQLPLTIDAETREQIRENLGVNDHVIVKWGRWAQQMLINEPHHAFESITGICIGECNTGEGDPELARIISWSSRAPAMNTIIERVPQTLWVLGLAFLLGTILAIPVGVVSAYGQYSWYDNLGTVVTTIGYSAPTFFTGLLAIKLFSSSLGWFPSFYSTTHEVSLLDLGSLWIQLKQMIMPVTVLTLFNAAVLSRFTRASTLDNLNQDYVRTARSKGLSEFKVVNVHVMRNSMIPVTTLIALSIPSIFSGAIITEQVFRINGLGQILVVAIGQGDLPMVQTLTFMFAILTVMFNLIADLIYGFLDPRIRYD